MFVSVAATNLTHMTCLQIAETEEPEKEVRSLFLLCAQWIACATLAGVQQISFDGDNWDE